MDFGATFMELKFRFYGQVTGLDKEVVFVATVMQIHKACLHDSLRFKAPDGLTKSSHTLLSKILLISSKLI